MTSSIEFKSEQWQSQMQAIVTVIRTLAESKAGDSLALLALLRQLEALHREIRDGIFQTALPDNRQALYILLKDIESQGGWPYIERMKLQTLLAKLSDPALEPSDGASLVEVEETYNSQDADRSY